MWPGSLRPRPAMPSGAPWRDSFVAGTSEGSVAETSSGTRATGVSPAPPGGWTSPPSSPGSRSEGREGAMGDSRQATAHADPPGWNHPGEKGRRPRGRLSRIFSRHPVRRGAPRRPRRSARRGRGSAPGGGARSPETARCGGPGPSDGGELRTRRLPRPRRAYFDFDCFAFMSAFAQPTVIWSLFAMRQLLMRPSPG